MICGRLPLAMTAIDGSSPLALPGFPEPVVTNPEVTNPFRTALPQRKIGNDVTGFTKGAGRFALVFRNDGETYQSFDPAAGIGTDYALIAGGIAATLIALTYLIMS
jgi:hypothetical protein